MSTAAIAGCVPATPPAARTLEALRGKPVAEVAREFEAMLLAQMIGAMRKTVGDSGLLSASPERRCSTASSISRWRAQPGRQGRPRPRRASSPRSSSASTTAPRTARPRAGACRRRPLRRGARRPAPATLLHAGRGAGQLGLRRAPRSDHRRARLPRRPRSRGAARHAGARRGRRHGAVQRRARRRRQSGRAAPSPTARAPATRTSRRRQVAAGQTVAGRAGAGRRRQHRAEHRTASPLRRPPARRGGRRPGAAARRGGRLKFFLHLHDKGLCSGAIGPNHEDRRTTAEPHSRGGSQPRGRGGASPRAARPSRRRRRLRTRCELSPLRARAGRAAQPRSAIRRRSTPSASPSCAAPWRRARTTRQRSEVADALLRELAANRLDSAGTRWTGAASRARP